MFTCRNLTIRLFCSYFKFHISYKVLQDIHPSIDLHDVLAFHLISFFFWSFLRRNLHKVKTSILISLAVAKMKCATAYTER